jgi:hypothetical protein
MGGTYLAMLLTMGPIWFFSRSSLPRPFSTTAGKESNLAKKVNGRLKIGSNSGWFAQVSSIVASLAVPSLLLFNINTGTHRTS